MHCFEGHHVSTLGEITSNSGGHHVQELDSVNKLISDGKLKANEIRNNLKNLETTSTRLSSQYQKSLSEVNETFQFYVSMLEERKAEIARELEQAYSSKQVALSVYSQKAQETVDKIFQVTDFVERLMKHASNGEVLMFKKTFRCSAASVANIYTRAEPCHIDRAGIYLKLSGHTGW